MFSRRAIFGLLAGLVSGVVTKAFAETNPVGKVVAFDESFPRIKVRIPGHYDGLTDEDLPWAYWSKPESNQAYLDEGPTGYCDMLQSMSDRGVQMPLAVVVATGNTI